MTRRCVAKRHTAKKCIFFCINLLICFFFFDYTFINGIYPALKPFFSVKDN